MHTAEKKQIQLKPTRRILIHFLSVSYFKNISIDGPFLWYDVSFFMMHSYSIARSRKLIKSKDVGRFCIPLGPVCVPGVFRFDVGVSATASTSVNIIHFHHACPF